MAQSRRSLSGLNLLLLVLGILLAGCARTPKFDVSDVDVHLTPAQAVAQIDGVRGRKVQWGGIIISTRNLKDTTQLEVLAYPLDGDGRPQPRETPLGRFLALHSGYLESVDYAPGRAVTVIGRLQETRAGTVGEANYVYPVVTAEQLHLWAKPGEHTEPRFHFGIGVGIFR